MSQLTTAEIAEFDTALQLRSSALLEAIRQHTQQATIPDDSVVGGLAPEPAELQETEQQNDVGTAQLALEYAEMAEITGALKRIEDGTYGVCTDCGNAIALARLRVLPTARHCIRCQEALEKTAAGTSL
jgi:DnaK suppressor protein